MARRFAQTLGQGDRIPRSVSLPSAQPAPASDTRQRMAQALGARVTAQLGWNTAHYTPAELAALGEQLILDHAMHGDDAAGARMLVALSQAAGAVQATPPDLHDDDKLADRIAEFLTSEFKTELAVSDAASRLAGLRMPRRPDLARELLQGIGLDPDRRVDTPELVDPDNPLATNEAKKAADYYFNYDALSARDIRNMSDRPLSDAEVAAKRAALPASLDAEFSRRFDTYTRTAAETTIKLVDGWLSWIARKLGVNLDDARVELSTVRLQYYRRRMQLLRSLLVPYNSTTLHEVSSAGYIATIHTDGHEYRYFLSTADGGALPMPTDTPATGWALRHAGTVFGVPSGAAGQSSTSPRRLRARVVSDRLAQGKRAGLSTWLAPTLRSRFGQARPAARGQTPGEHAIDTLLDFIPFRRMIVAIRQGDFATALIAGGIDVMTFAIPMLCSGLRLAAGASRALVPLARQAGRAMAGAAIEQPARAAMVELPDLRSSIKAGLEALNATGSTAGDLRPVDAEAMASALRGRHPRLADALDRATLQVRGTGLRDGWWQVSGSAAAPSTDAGITGLQQVPARSVDDQALSLLPYGDDSGRAYTQVDPTTQERCGAILLSDSQGWLYESLPVDTMGRYRISAPDLLRELGARRPGTDGTLQLGGKHYARVANDYVEIVREHASTQAHPAWRVVAPPAARRDIVTHRLRYDGAKGLWRRADVPELKGGGITSKRPAPGDGSAAEGEGSAPKRNLGEPPPPDSGAAPSLPSMGPSSLQLDAFRQVLLSRIEGTATAAQREGVHGLLATLQAHPRGKAILSAMQAYYELRGQAPRIVLLDGQDGAALRPALRRPLRGAAWHLDLDAMRAGSSEAAVKELAAVYNNMTGILQHSDLLREMVGGGPPLHGDLDSAWTKWTSAEDLHDAAPDVRATVASQRQSAIEELRPQLREARLFGGVKKRTLEAVLLGKIEPDRLGLHVDLAHVEIAQIPPLPGDVHTLDISGNAITDWSGLPRNLKVLNAAQTGGEKVLDHLPDDLIGLDVSKNDLHRLPADRLPRELKRLRADNNRLREVPALPARLQNLHLSGNEISVFPEQWPGNLRTLDMSSNMLTTLPGDLPAGLKELDLSDNCLVHIAPDRMPDGLTALDLSDNPDLNALPTLPASLKKLWIDATGLRELPADLPRGLLELYAADLGLTRLPDSLPGSLTILGLVDNELMQLPPDIVDLTTCEIFLEGNPIPPENLPLRLPGEVGPVFRLSVSGGEKNIDYSVSVAQAVRHWLDAQQGEAAQRWDAISHALDDASPDAAAAAQFRRFVDELRATASYEDPHFRASVQEWLVELSKPERKSLLDRALQACATATERCDDRVALTFNELKKMWMHDDIRIGRYDGRAADAVNVIRQTFRLDKLQDIAYRKIKSLPRVDDVEVYLGYAVKLREPLELSTVVPDMRFFSVSGITQADLDAALQEVREAERSGFYRELVLDDTWNAYIKPKLAARYEGAEDKLGELADAPLQQRIRAELQQRGLDPDDLDAYRGISKSVWQDMRYEVLEPLTRDYLTSQGLPLPAGAPG
jgi:Leucine-rich repeat (LRR) protein